MTNDGITDDDLRHLLALRSAFHRGPPRPAVPFGPAGKLGQLAFVRPTTGPGVGPTGGIEITEAGVRYLDEKFLFCGAFGCDGILRRWALLHEADPPLGQCTLDGTGHHAITCKKCGSINILAGTEIPDHRAGYKIIKVITDV
jgi:hypothetical protein